MVSREDERKIIDYVQQQPCTIQEIARLVQRNWRTADNYVADIARHTGLIATRTFREGTRGALKIVYWNALDKQHQTTYQARLLERILAGRQKEDFSAFDIYQFVNDKHRSADVVSEENQIGPDELLKMVGEQWFSLSGNLSWLRLYPNVLKQFEKLAHKRIAIKIITRIDMTSADLTRKLLAINERVGWDAIAVRHAEQPLRAIIVDNRIASLKEVLSPKFPQYRELEKKTYIFYRINEEEWVSWLQKVFWAIWETSVDAKIRLDALETLNRSYVNKKIK